VLGKTLATRPVIPVVPATLLDALYVDLDTSLVRPDSSAPDGCSTIPLSFLLLLAAGFNSCLRTLVDWIVSLFFCLKSSAN
jgi:hypothetical protein